MMTPELMMQQTPKENSGLLIKEVDSPEAGLKEFNFVCYDFEWDMVDGHIWEAAFVDFKYGWRVLRLDDFKDLSAEGWSQEKQLVWAINKELSKFEAGFGFNNTSEDSDNHRLLQRFQYYKLRDCIVQKKDGGRKPIWDLSGKEGMRCFDLMRVFEKKLVQLSIFNNGYRNFKLDTISNFFLGEGKFTTVQEASLGDVNIQKCYVLKDALLVRRLIEVGEKKGDKQLMDRGILNMLWAIADIIEKAKTENGINRRSKMLADVVNSNITTWWKIILDDYTVGRGLKPTFIPARFQFKYKNLGGGIVDPVPGKYENVEVVDVASLYPSMVINYNLSYDSVSTRIWENINGEPTLVTHGCGRADCETDGYRLDEFFLNDVEAAHLKEHIGDTWFCNPIYHRRGLFSERSKVYKDIRMKYKDAGNVVMATGLKILLNGGYGGFANEFWAYRDMRIAEAVTAFGRYTTLKKMKPKAEELGFKVLYGDTDSLFLLYIGAGDKAQAMKDLIAWAKSDLDITLEHEKSFAWVEIVGKKHYMGRLTNGKLLIKGMEGKKGDRCKWVRYSFDEVVDAIDKGTDPTIPLRSAIEKFRNNQISPDWFKLTIKLSKGPDAYKGNCTSKQAGELHKAQEGDLVWFYKARKGITLEYGQIDKEKYIKDLRSVVEEPIKLAGYSMDGEKEQQRTGDFG